MLLKSLGLRGTRVESGAQTIIVNLSHSNYTVTLVSMSYMQTYVD